MTILSFQIVSFVWVKKNNHQASKISWTNHLIYSWYEIFNCICIMIWFNDLKYRTIIQESKNRVIKDTGIACQPRFRRKISWSKAIFPITQNPIESPSHRRSTSASLCPSKRRMLRTTFQFLLRYLLCKSLNVEDFSLTLVEMQCQCQYILPLDFLNFCSETSNRNQQNTS